MSASSAATRAWPATRAPSVAYHRPGASACFRCGGVVVAVLRWVGGWFGVHRPPNRAGCRPWERTGPTQFGRAMTPGGEEKTPPGPGPGTSTGSGVNARFAAPARSTARCSRWRRNGGGGACVPLSVDGEALLVHNRTRPRPYIAHRADHRPEGPRSTKGMAQATTPGQGTPRGCGPVSSTWPQAIQASWSDSAKVSVNTPKLGAVSRPTATWFMAPRVTPLVGHRGEPGDRVGRDRCR